MKIGVLGGSGYVGGELLRLLIANPKVDVTLTTSRVSKGEFIYRVHPNLRGRTQLRFSPPNLSEITEKCDFVFSALPHGKSFSVLPKLLEVGMRVVDLSADFRLKDPADYAKWYGFEHPHPSLLKTAVYGLPELYREAIRKAGLVAVPGCMATVSILSLAPIIKAQVIDTTRIVIDAKIGSSGAGARPTIASHHPERFGGVRPYKVVGHRHIGEIEQELKVLADSQVIVSFTPHAVNMVRGILVTAHVFASKNLSVSEVWQLYRGAYGEEAFIRLVRDRKGLYGLPDPKAVIGSNFCDIGFEYDSHSSRLVILSAIDNMLKGAAGQAVQCFNIMTGLEETAGLDSLPIHPM